MTVLLDSCRVVRARSLSEAIKLLASETGVALIAGGTDLVVKLKDGALRPSVLVAIDGLPELSTIEGRDGEGLWVGAAATHADIMASPAVRDSAPLLAAACATVGSPQIRNRGTIGGNVVTASPAGDAIPALLCLDAVVHIDGAAGERAVPAERFFVGPGRTVLAAGEMVTGFLIPPTTAARRWAYRKLGQRKALSVSIAGVAVTLGIVDGAVVHARVALGSVAPTVRRAPALERALIGPVPDETHLMDLAALAREAASPITDIRGSATYRLDMVEALTYQALYEALHCDPSQPGAAATGPRPWPPLERTADDVGQCCGRGAARRDAGLDEARPAGTVRIEIALHGGLSAAGAGAGDAPRTMDLPAGTSVAGLWKHLGVDGDGYIVALVNGRRYFDDMVLNDGDKVSLMRPVGGG